MFNDDRDFPFLEWEMSKELTHIETQSDSLQGFLHYFPIFLRRSDLFKEEVRGASRTFPVGKVTKLFVDRQKVAPHVAKNMIFLLQKL